MACAATAERKKEANTYADEALKVLRQAVDKGFKDAEYLKRTDSFDPLREREEFKELLRRLEKP
jgi:hypothetical protein